MRFLKEYLILLIIIVFVVGSDIFFTNMTKNLVKSIDEKVSKISEKIFEEGYNKDEMLKKIEELEKEWSDTEEKMSYFAEHNELEKVSGTIVSMKSNINMDKKIEAYENTEDIKFRLEYIKEKQRFELNNLF